MINSLFLIVATIIRIEIINSYSVPYNDVLFDLNTLSNENGQELHGLLYPRESESREVKSLDGLWNFGIISEDHLSLHYFDEYIPEDFFKSVEMMQMPVPSSYNDITTSGKLRDHVGAVWYARNFFIPYSWIQQRVFIRFGAVNYYARVFINHQFVTSQGNGYLPFEIEISQYLVFGNKNHIIVGVSNVLRKITIPQGELSEVETDDGATWIQSYAFDFFNYAGIHRSVLLHTKPRVYISDIKVETEIQFNVGIINYKVEILGVENNSTYFCQVKLYDADGKLVTEQSEVALAGTIKVYQPNFWWPRGMNSHPGYLYTLEVTLVVHNLAIRDTYRLPVGIRTLYWSNNSFLINNKPAYMRGFGRHEDSVLRGRGLDLVTMTRDYELLKWVGANAFRTSHYPFSDEDMDMADKLGFLVINECPSVGTSHFTPTLLKRHKSSIVQLIQRDKNRPSVIMWSITNEPQLKLPEAIEYFEEVAKYTRNLDLTRPITACLHKEAEKNTIGSYVDIIGVNRHNLWNQYFGRLDMITGNVINQTSTWHKKFDKPVLITEYGVNAIPGLHKLPESTWSEEYQIAMFSKHFKAFDVLRNQNWFIGEFVWNFADYHTSQSKGRIGDNRKGIFTRDREPKTSAHHVRKRYHALGTELDGQKSPADLVYYSSKRHIKL